MTLDGGETLCGGRKARLPPDNFSSFELISSWAGACDTKVVRRLFVHFASVCTALLLSACAMLPMRVEREPSRAIPLTPSTALGALASSASRPEAASGFRLLPSPDFAFNARVELLTRAEQSLDVQYYVIRDDASGRHYLRLLRDAARRGVRVRLLVDDLYTSGEDSLLLGLAAEPHFEVRLFNPFPSGRERMSSKFMSSLFDFSRVNRRMHNKMMIADGAFAVIGGRNVADDYFLRSGLTTFLDLDVLATGALVPRLSDIFDLYWNSAPAYPIEAIVSDSTAPADRRRIAEKRLGTISDLATLPARDILGYPPVGEEMGKGALDLVWAQAHVVADDPEKAFGVRTEGVRHRIRERVREAVASVVISTPYLVPGSEGMQTIRLLREHGVRVAIVTNSLASTDEPLTFVGYLRYRATMLRLGVDIHEVTQRRIREGHRFRLFGASSGRLHAKSAVIDGKTVFMGSMNLDPRSDRHNTETGLLIDSPELARQMLRLIDFVKQDAAYEVRLTRDGSTQWLNPEPQSGEPATFSSEPGTGLLERLLLRLLGPLVPESLL